MERVTAHGGELRGLHRALPENAPGRRAWAAFQREHPGADDRTGRTALALAIEVGLLLSDTPQVPARLGLPAKGRKTYFLDYSR